MWLPTRPLWQSMALRQQLLQGWAVPAQLARRRLLPAANASGASLWLGSRMLRFWWMDQYLSQMLKLLQLLLLQAAMGIAPCMQEMQAGCKQQAWSKGLPQQLQGEVVHPLPPQLISPLLLHPLPSPLQSPSERLASLERAPPTHAQQQPMGIPHCSSRMCLQSLLRQPA